MDYKDFTARAKAYDGFVFFRKEILDSVESGQFNEAFTELCARALAGDCVTQDVAAYFFKRGVPGLLVPNYDLYMSWQILAGANGNEFALEKLEFFLNLGLDEIIEDDDILSASLRKGNVTKDNAVVVISNLICEGIVDELKLDPKKLVEIPPKAVDYSPELNRKYSTALEKSLPKVIKFLIS